MGVANGETALRLEAGLRLDGDASPRRIVVDHAVVVVPEHVLRGGGTLQRKSDAKHEAAAWTLQISYFACNITPNQHRKRSLGGTRPAYEK